jgi:hypothetical protein
MLLLATLTFTWAVPREMVVVEIGTGTWCPYCPGASMGAHDLLEGGYDVAVIKNHNGDPYANTYSNTRNSYYGISSFPTAVFDGLTPVAGGSNTQSMFSNYLPRVNARLAIPSKYTITAEGSLDGNVLSVDVTVSKPEADTNTNVFLRSAITESNIQQNWQGQTELDNVNRLMSPSATGTAINLNTGESTTVTLTFTLDSAWQIPNLELVLFLQNNTSKEILQGKKYSVPGLTGAFPASSTSLNFPDTYVGGMSYMPVTFFNYSDNPVNASISSSSTAFIPELANLNLGSLQSATVMVYFAPDAQGEFSGNLSVSGNFTGHSEFDIALSGFAFLNAAPMAEDVVISGPPVIHLDLTGTYTFSDSDEDAEGSSEYQWYRHVGGENQAIAGANEISYRPETEDYDLQLVFGVTPIDEHGMPGEEVFSEPSDAIIMLPAPQNFAGVLEPPNTVILTWEKPLYLEDRGFVGYRLYRNDLLISTITSTNTLSFTDLNVADGEYEYKIASLFTNPMEVSLFSPSVFITVDSTDNEDLVNVAQFTVNALPNPFAGNTSFSIKSSPNHQVKLSVYNLKGQQVKSWRANSDSQGSLTLSWDGKDSRGINCDSGIYLYKMESAGKTVSGRIIKMK